MPATRIIFSTAEEVTPGYVPDVDTDVIAQDAWIVLIVLTAVSGSATVTITDKQGTPVPLIASFPVDPGSPVVMGFPSNDPAFMKGGIKWICSAANTVVARLRFKY